MSKAGRMTHQQRVAWMDEFEAVRNLGDEAKWRPGADCWCEYGHDDCSTSQGGACMDEVLGLIQQHRSVTHAS